MAENGKSFWQRARSNGRLKDKYLFVSYEEARETKGEEEEEKQARCHSTTISRWLHLFKKSHSSVFEQVKIDTSFFTFSLEKGASATNSM